jgi:hypothetical protein
MYLSVSVSLYAWVCLFDCAKLLKYDTATNMQQAEHSKH